MRAACTLGVRTSGQPADRLQREPGDLASVAASQAPRVYDQFAEPRALVGLEPARASRNPMTTQRAMRSASTDLKRTSRAMNQSSDSVLVEWNCTPGLPVTLPADSM